MRKKEALSILMVLLSFSTTSVFANNLSEGKRLYAMRNYNKAAKFFSQAVNLNSKDATAHYYLANCYVAKHDFGEAKAEYQYAAAFTKDESMKDYCLWVVAGLESLNSGFRNSAGALPGSLNSSEPAKSTTPPAVAKRFIAKSNDEAQRTVREAQRQVQTIESEKAAELATLRATNRAGVTIGSAEEQEDLAGQYDKRIYEIRKQAAQRADSIRKRGAEDARRATL